MADPKEVDVQVVLTPSGNPKWHLESDLLDKDGKLVFKNNGHPGFYVYFKLKDPEKSRYQFPDDAGMALAAAPVVGQGAKCPDQNAKPWSQFKALKVKKGFFSRRNMTLKVHDPNAPGQECEFGYSLFVTLTPDGSGPYWKLDPGGINQNGRTQ
jgi:hypothetical protein